MPLSLDALTNDVADLVVAVGDEKINLRFRPNVVTPELEAKMLETARSSEEGQGMELARLLDEVLVTWDIVEHEGDTEPIPCTVEGIARMPIVVLSEISQKIGEAMVVPGKTSRSGRRRS